MTETLYHLLVECHYKWALWQSAISSFIPGYPTSEVTPVKIWEILILHNTSISSSHILRIAIIFGGVWKAHWHFHFENNQWLHSFGMGVIAADFAKLLMDPE